MKKLREIINHMNNNTQALDNKVNDIGMTKVKLLFIECFNGTRLKLKGFLLQIKFKIIQESLKIGIPMDQVVYTGLFLTGRALKWFEPYLTKIQINRLSIMNQEVRYIFSSQDGFVSRLTQIYKDLEAVMTVKQKLSELVQKGSTTDYTIIF